MSYVLAIDVGTSFTAAAIVRFSQGATPAPECLPLGLRGTAVPSVLYYPEEGPILVGEAAERRGLDSPGRVVREFKRRVGDAVPLSVGTLSLPPEDVFATMARWVADRASEREGEPPSEVILTHPASWGTHRTSVVLAAMAAKGLENVTLVPEPEAAALYYASQVRVEVGSTVAVYDLGGGTFDTAVLRKAGSDRFQLVGRPEGIENLGGADFDAAVFRYVAAHTGDVLSALDPDEAGVRSALGRLRRECVEAKEALSADSEASISVLLPGFQQQVRLVRAEFEALIEDAVRDTIEALEESLAQLELEPKDLSAVLLIGGSSRIPLVAQLISERLDRPIAVDADPKSSICLGAAVSAILARAEMESPAAAAGAEVPAEAAGTAVVPAPEAVGHVALRKASWSRKVTTPGSALADAAAAAHGQGGAHGGAHAPKPTVRLTAIAAAAALVTVLTATAAQGPAGFSNLTSIFVPEAGAAPEGPGGAGGSGPGAAAAGAPVAGIEAGIDAGVNKQAAGGPGLDIAASPTSRPSPSGSADAAGGAAAGAGAAAGPAAGSGATSSTGTPATAIEPATGQPAPVTGQPLPATDPTTPAPETATPGPAPTTETPPPPTPTTDSAPAPTTEAPPPPATEAPPPPTTDAPPPPTETSDAPPPATEPAVSESAAPVATEPAA
ncbi:MAG: Hsp70 family protein [Arthrobacter sp.]